MILHSIEKVAGMVRDGVEFPWALMSPNPAEQAPLGYWELFEDITAARLKADLECLKGADQQEFYADMAYLASLSNAMFELDLRRLPEPDLMTVEMELALSLSPDEYDAVFGAWES